MTDTNKEFEFSEECIEKAGIIKFRAELLTYSKSFFESLDLLFNVLAGTSYWVPAKRLGYLLWRIKERYKDDTMDLKWASAKVRKLIDKHLVSLGIDTKISSVSILSQEFRSKVEHLNKTPKSKASEMEHAIRWHIKINIDKDPALYNHFKDRLERILNAYKENWEAIVSELEKLRDEMSEGRKTGTEGISNTEAPFYDLLKAALKNEDSSVKLKELTHIVINILKESASVNNFWIKPPEIRKMEGQLEDEICYSRIEGVSERAAELTSELMKLAKNRISDLR
jgi:type I restriction enzyme R subunit